jgi:hypothetical protein
VRRLVSHVVLGVEIAVFALVCLVASPMILFKFTFDQLRDRIEARWPDSYRAQVVSFWIGLLAPVILFIVLGALLAFAISRVRDANQRMGG